MSVENLQTKWVSADTCDKSQESADTPPEEIHYRNSRITIVLAGQDFWVATAIMSVLRLPVPLKSSVNNPEKDKAIALAKSKVDHEIKIHGPLVPPIQGPQHK